MLAESLLALASASGAAVAAAAGTDAWLAFREGVGRLFGRGDEQETTIVLARLDRSGAEVEAAEPADVERVRARVGAVWQGRFEDLLENVEGSERERLAEGLRELMGSTGARVRAGDGGVAVGGNVGITAEGGSAAAWAIGTVNLENPPSPGPHRS
ncbi:hypothetical protein OG948_55875 (plasmid) [Embleya sp. NBC_00888]|uniref:hypothetical protein n=1 Tax=Embleya sp. NBC_00888 TaxID=2975960 RepID=UPI002F911981|nr:hypothetical protein OG948_55875 [Embleya sp. NBC_00888]